MKSYGSANIKIALLIGGVIIIMATLMYTQILATEILEREREIANLYAKAIEYITREESVAENYDFVWTNVVNSHVINFPIIVTDAKTGLPSLWTNLDIDTTLPKQKQQELMMEMIAEMDKVNMPIRVVQENMVLNYVHYGQSKLVTKLKILPFIEIIVATVFIFLGYFGFSYIRRTEQSNIWVGLSRETAHQLGTPLSSLMGWNELIKVNVNNPEKVTNLSTEMSSDIDRMVKIANRFSKIGSKPDLKTENLYDVIDKVVQYYEKRIPRISTGSFNPNAEKRKIKMEIKGSRTLGGLINRELFEWVLENLIKNAIDAIDHDSGSITFNIEDKGGHINIDVSDSGKGIDMKFKKDIFRPGYSTKQRGWGLGLTLSKRIIEAYHSGKLTVKSSEPGKGTTFRIKLNKYSSKV
jgi:K+-sensing histidine kinase KdpD